MRGRRWVPPSQGIKPDARWVRPYGRPMTPRADRMQRNLEALVYRVSGDEGDGGLLDGGDSFAHSQPLEFIGP